MTKKGIVRPLLSSQFGSYATFQCTNYSHVMCNQYFEIKIMHAMITLSNIILFTKELFFLVKAKYIRIG